MKEVFVHSDFTRVGHGRSILEAAGIPCFIQNESTYHLMTGFPIPQFYPSLRVTHDEDEERAIGLLREFLATDEGLAPEWKCAQCGETVPGNFGACWKCDAPRSAVLG